MDTWHWILSSTLGVVFYFLREKHIAHNVLEVRVQVLERRADVQDEANKNRDNKIETMDKKLDRLLEKLGA